MPTRAAPAPAVLVVLPVVAACATATAQSDFARRFAEPIERTHGIEAWNDHEVVACEMTLEFGGSMRFEGTMMMQIGPERTRMEAADGSRTIVWDGQAAWVTPADATADGARFEARTWPYFLAAPFKLRDPGVNLDPTDEPYPLAETALDTPAVRARGTVTFARSVPGGSGSAAT